MSPWKKVTSKAPTTEASRVVANMKMNLTSQEQFMMTQQDSWKREETRSSGAKSIKCSKDKLSSVEVDDHDELKIFKNIRNQEYTGWHLMLQYSLAWMQLLGFSSM
jgi:hypothetical protein